MYFSAWKMEPDPLTAVECFRKHILEMYETGKPLRLHMDLRDTEEDREKSLLSFYKTNREWACPLECSLDGKVFNVFFFLIKCNLRSVFFFLFINSFLKRLTLQVYISLL